MDISLPRVVREQLLIKVVPHGLILRVAILDFVLQMMHGRDKETWRRTVTSVTDNIANATTLAARPVTVIVNRRANLTLTRLTAEYIVSFKHVRATLAVTAARRHDTLLTMTLTGRLITDVELIQRPGLVTVTFLAAFAVLF